MGTLDEIREQFGEAALQPRPPGQRGPQAWYELCVCGHLGKFHSPDIGGSFVIPAPTSTPRGATRHDFTGCRGAISGPGAETESLSIDHDREPPLMVTTLLRTCPCSQLRPVVRLDRPGRFFNQRVADRKDPTRHPFMVGIRAFRTHLSKRRMALSDPTWADAEFERRFVWTARVCDIGECKVTEAVFPVFINDDTTELRCPKHRPTADSVDGG